MTKSSIFRRLNALYSTRPYFYGAALIAFLAKILIDAGFYFFDSVYNPFDISFRVLLSAIILISISSFFYQDFKRSEREIWDAKSNRYLRELSIVVALLFIIAVVQGYLPEEISRHRIPRNFLSLLFIEFFSLFVALGSARAIYFLLEIFSARKDKNARRKLSLFLIIAVLFPAFEIFSQFWKFSPLDFSLDGGILGAAMLIFSVLSIILVVVLLFLSFVQSGNSKKLATLPKNAKTKALFLNLAGLILSILILSYSSSDGGEGKFSVAAEYFFGADSLSFAAALALLPFFTRATFSLVLSLPTTGIIEKTSVELDSLTYLNRVLSSGSINRKKIFETTAELALKVCGGSAAWIYVLDDPNKFIEANMFISEEILRKIDPQGKLKKILATADEPVLVDSAAESEKFASFDWNAENLIKSFIALPLYSQNKKIGVLIVASPEEYGFDYDDVKILRAFGDNAKIAFENIDLLQASIDKEKYLEELKLARDIQRKLLPVELPKIENFSIAAKTKPALEVGGDFYDVSRLADGSYCFLIGDVSGKGMSAAFYAAQFKGAFVSLSAYSFSPKELLSKLNRALYPSLDKRIFVTAAAIAIEPNARRIRYARAGHPPLFCRLNGEELTLKPKGIGIGLTGSKLFDKEIEEIFIEAKRGDALLALTDGLLEASEKDDRRLDYSKTKQILKNSVNNTAGEIVEQAFESAGAENRFLRDDATALAIVLSE